jgi:hypothetical protein
VCKLDGESGVDEHGWKGDGTKGEEIVGDGDPGLKEGADENRLVWRGELGRRKTRLLPAWISRSSGQLWGWVGSGGVVNSNSFRTEAGKWRSVRGGQRRRVCSTQRLQAAGFERLLTGLLHAMGNGREDWGMADVTAEGGRACERGKNGLGNSVCVFGENNVKIW